MLTALRPDQTGSICEFRGVTIEALPLRDIEYGALRNCVADMPRSKKITRQRSANCCRMIRQRFFGRKELPRDPISIWKGACPLGRASMCLRVDFHSFEGCLWAESGQSAFKANTGQSCHYANAYRSPAGSNWNMSTGLPSITSAGPALCSVHNQSRRAQSVALLRVRSETR